MILDACICKECEALSKEDALEDRFLINGIMSENKLSSVNPRSAHKFFFISEVLTGGKSIGSNKSSTDPVKDVRGARTIVPDSMPNSFSCFALGAAEMCNSGLLINFL